MTARPAQCSAAGQHAPTARAIRAPGPAGPVRTQHRSGEAYVACRAYVMGGAYQVSEPYEIGRVRGMRGAYRMAGRARGAAGPARAGVGRAGGTHG